MITNKSNNIKIRLKTIHLHYSEVMLQFWKNVKDELEYNLMTQKELAESINISYNTLQSWITKDRLPDAEKAVNIAKKLNTTVEYLVTGKSKVQKDDNRKIILNIQKEMNSVFDEYLEKPKK